MDYVILADTQDITRAGLMFVCGQIAVECSSASDKATLMEILQEHKESVVILDYTLLTLMM